MKNSIVQYTIVVMWLVGFIFCLIPVFIAYHDIPNLFQQLLNEVIESFTPQLAIMFAFLFSDMLTKRKGKTINRFTAIIAIVVSFIYILFNSILLIEFQVEKLNASQVINIIESFRPKTLFLTSGIISYYFASRNL